MRQSLSLEMSGEMGNVEHAIQDAEFAGTFGEHLRHFDYPIPYSFRAAVPRSRFRGGKPPRLPGSFTTLSALQAVLGPRFTAG